METTIKKAAKINQSITLKALIIGFLTLILLIPGLMIQDLIRERQNRRKPEYHNTVISRGKILRYLQNDPLQKRDRHNRKLRQNKLPQTGKQYHSLGTGLSIHRCFRPEGHNRKHRLQTGQQTIVGRSHR